MLSSVLSYSGSYEIAGIIANACLRTSALLPHDDASLEMAATLSIRGADSGRDAVAGFLQDVIGKEESLNPSCGRLREIHARIGKEVQDAKVRSARMDAMLKMLSRRARTSCI
jgi:hypothetical protein